MKLATFFATATVLSLTISAAAPGTAQAQVCEAGTPQDALQYLRRLSLDLRGRLPSYEELYTVANTGVVDPALIDQMLASEELVERVRAMHRDLLWTNVSDQRLTNNVWQLRGPGRQLDGPAYYLGGNGRLNRYRGGAATCLDEPATFDPTTGAILTTPDPVDPNIQREGWVEVEPYWAPGTTVRVCAFDAQANLTGRLANGNMVDCSTQAGVGSRECGCGPNLRWCESVVEQTRLTIVNSMNEQMLRFIDDLVRNDRAYTELLLGQTIEVNGPLSHWLRYQAGTGNANGLFASTEQNYPVPELDFSNTSTWQEVQRGERHAGVLSMPGYLVKFQSNRGRANRFYNAFLCQQFESSEPLPPASDPCHAEPDLTERCGCKDCHVAVEPAAAYWGRWGEAGLVPLNEDTFPKVNGCCITGGDCPPERRREFNAQVCSRFYYTARDLTGPDDPTAIYVGTLKSYVFADAAREANIAAGPEGIARAAIDSGAFASCTARRMWTQLMAREPLPEEEQTISELGANFASGYSLKSLMKDLVTRPEYVQAGRYGLGE